MTMPAHLQAGTGSPAAPQGFVGRTHIMSAGSPAAAAAAIWEDVGSSGGSSSSLHTSSASTGRGSPAAAAAAVGRRGLMSGGSDRLPSRPHSVGAAEGELVGELSPLADPETSLR